MIRTARFTRFIVQLERAAGFTREDTVEQKLGKLRNLLTPAARDDDESELLAALLCPRASHGETAGETGAPHSIGGADER